MMDESNRGFVNSKVSLIVSIGVVTVCLSSYHMRKSYQKSLDCQGVDFIEISDNVCYRFLLGCTRSQQAGSVLKKVLAVGWKRSGAVTYLRRRPILRPSER